MKFPNLNVSLLFSVVLACSLSPSAVADDSGFYVEFNVGQSNASESTTSLDENATAFRLAAGFQIASWLSVDVGYIDFGNYDGELTVQGDGTFPFKATASGMEMGLIGRIPLGEKFAATVKAEQIWWDSEIRALGEKIDDSGQSFAYGAGLEFDISDRFALTGAWQQFQLRNTDVDLLSLGVKFRF